MTAKRDLKKRVRERQARTGEAYTTARARVLGERPEPPAADPVPVVEMVDITDAAAQLGVKCRVLIASGFAARIGATTAVTRMRDALIATEDDPDLRAFRGVVLLGERPPAAEPRHELRDVAGLRRFLARVHAGIGGTSPAGRILALAAGGEMMLCVLSVTSRFDPAAGPYVTLTSIEDSLTGVAAWLY